MIVRRLGDEWIVIDQAEHARHAGQLAESWAKGPLSDGVLAGGLITAARLHDLGWSEPDATPYLDPATGGPVHFTKVSDDRHAGFYAAGIRDVAAADAYAGYLVSLHATGIYAGRFGWLGLQSIAWETIGDHGRRFLDEQASLRRALLEAHVLPAATLELEAAYRDYMLLQTFDYLSLFVCAGLDSDGCGPVPQGRHGWLRLRISEARPGVARLEPFPFLEEALELRVRCRRLAEERFDSEAELRRSWATSRISEFITRFERP